MFQYIDAKDPDKNPYPKKSVQQFLERLHASYKNSSDNVLASSTSGVPVGNDLDDISNQLHDVYDSIDDQKDGGENPINACFVSGDDMDSLEKYHLVQQQALNEEEHRLYLMKYEDYRRKIFEKTQRIAKAEEDWWTEIEEKVKQAYVKYYKDSRSEILPNFELIERRLKCECGCYQTPKITLVCYKVHVINACESLGKDDLVRWNTDYLGKVPAGGWLLSC
jgi:hypothetical protein